MKILYGLHQFYPYFYTGTELLTLNIASYIKKMGNKPYIVAYKPENRVTEIKTHVVNDIDTYHIGIDREDVTRDVRLSNDLVKKYLNDIFDKTQPDIVHVTHLSRMGDIVEVAKERKIPYMLTLTDFWTICPRATLLLPNNMNCAGPLEGRKCPVTCYQNVNYDFVKRFKEMKRILTEAKYVAYASDNLIKIIKDNLKIQSTNFVKIRHGYNTGGSVTRKKDGYFTFAYIGSLNIHKGSHILIKAFKKIKNDKLRLYIYGSKKDNSQYYEYIYDMAKTDRRIVFKGTYPKEETENVLSGIDAMVVPSIWRETFPFVATTSLAYGIPVIGSNIGGIPEIVNDRDLLFKPGDPNDLKEKMLHILDKNNYQKAKHVSFYNQRIETEGFEYLKLYEQILTS